MRTRLQLARLAIAVTHASRLRSFDKGCSKNLRDFVLVPELRDRDVEYNDSVAVPLLEAELTQLLSGGRSASAIVPIGLMGDSHSNSKHSS